MKQINRPAQITAILKKMDSDYSTEAETFLETYISSLEAKEQLGPSGKAPQVQWDLDNPPLWSHERAMQRQQHRRERVTRSLNEYS